MSTTKLTRRQAMQLLATFGITGTAAAELLAQQSGKKVSAQTLRDAGALIDAELTPEQIQVVSKVIQKNIDQYEAFRSLEIDDMVEPAPIFLARGRV
ncbi:MAG: hypothetical protein HY701_14540 [Gemmatimonadetes bacterium]|nr:hypothetical protein [Gemmatimonadota bacterium]